MINLQKLMNKQMRIVLLLILISLFYVQADSKNYLIHTVQYQLSQEKAFSMHTVDLHDQQLPALIMFFPENIINQENLHKLKSSPFVTQEDIAKQKQKFVQTRKKQSFLNFHKKLQTPIRVVIQHQGNIETQCLVDEPWDLCVIKNPSKALQFSIHCQVDLSLNQKGVCRGQAKIRQANLNNVPFFQKQSQQKIKYQSGFFSIPQSNKHALMIITCQDDDLPSFSESLRVFSSVKYHRYQRPSLQETKQLIGFDRINITQNNQNFMYLDVEEISVRKCLQFEYHSNKDIFSTRQVFDYLNLTDTSYKNVYDIVRVGQNRNADHINFFKYNMLITLNVFKPVQFTADQTYDIRIKILDKQKNAEIVSYVIPLAVSNQTSLSSTNLYSRSNHYHFSYVVGNQVIKSTKSLQVQISFDSKLQKTKEIGTIQIDSQEGSIQSKKGNNFFFINLAVEDMQNMAVEKLMTSYLSLKKGEHITFLIEEPYEVSQITAQNDKQSSDLVEIKTSSPSLKKTLSQYSSSDHQHVDECHFSKGCKFEIDASEDCLDCKIQYKSTFIKGPNDMLLLQIKNERFLGKIDLDQIQYFYKELKPLQVVQFIVNTPNIIVYTLQAAEIIQRCGIPKKSCHSQIATSHRMIILENKDKDSAHIVYFAVQGLDKTQFILTLTGTQNIISILNGQTFTYRIPQQTGQLQLMFDVPLYQQGKLYDKNITFNLASPLNSLQMSLVPINADDSQMKIVQKAKTMSGYLKLSSGEITYKKIKVILKKTLHYRQHSVHFTLIVSTSDHKYQLDTGITHYETFDPTEQKTFIIEFQDKQTYEINLNFYDTQDDQVAFNVAIYSPNEWKGKDKDLNYKIVTKSFTIFLDQALIDQKNLCPQNDPDCTLFVMISSMMAHSVQVSMTLLTSESVIQLKDGIWQNFKVDQLMVKSHFYFVPLHQDKPVKIFFKSSNPLLLISAILYDNAENVNPSQWPFPQTHQHGSQNNNDIQSDDYFKSNHLIQVDNEDSEYNKCFPNCVILMSILQNLQENADKNKEKSSSLSILASNNEVQLPQKMRVTLQLKEDEQQFIFVNLRHAFTQKKEFLTFFTNYMVGYTSIYAKVYLPSLQNIPDVDDYDFLFDPIKTQVSLVQIQQYFMENIASLPQIRSIEQILESQQLYLTILIQAHQNTKMTLQFTTDYDQIHQLEIDSVQNIYLQQNQQKIYQFTPTRDEKIKFIRNKGYPLFHQFKCEGPEYDKCLEIWVQKLKLKTESDIRNLKKQLEMQKQLSDFPTLTDKKMKQMAELSDQQYFSQYQVLQKTQTQHIIECQNCMIFIWIYALQPSQLTIQLQSMNTQVLLKQNQLLSDYLQPNEFHRYYLPRVQKQFTTIIVSINQGDPVVTVTDNLSYQETKKSTQIKQTGRKTLLFTVAPIKAVPQKGPDQSGSTRSFNKIFSNLHISVTPQDSRPVSYSITYSSGLHQMFLQSGVISNHFLFQNEKTIFYYQNDNKNAKSFLTLTVQATDNDLEQILRGIQIRMYSLILQKQTNELTRNQLLSEKPESASKALRKQTTLTYQIPPFQNIEIDVLSKATIKITVGISNGKMVFLPLNYEYPIFLKPKEEIRFVLENFEQSYLQMLIKKCDQSNPSIFYTNDADQFKKDTYSNYEKLSNQNILKHISKTKQKGTLYVKIKADPKNKSLLLISSKYVDIDFGNSVDIDPGNMGIIDYQFESLNEVELTITGLQCGQQCFYSTEYYLVRSKSLPKLYNQMVCAGQQMISLFQGKAVSQSKPKSLLEPIASYMTVQKIQSSPDLQTNKMIFSIPVSSEFKYVTIKAVYQAGGQQIYYRPIEIKTLQSNVENYSSNILYTFLGVVISGLLMIVCITQKVSRKGYVHVGQDETMIA